MNKYLAMGALGFLMGVKYRQMGRRGCLCMLKKQMRRVLNMLR